MAEIFKNILVPTDNSDNSKEAIKYAADLAEKYGSTLHVLHVIDTGYFDQFKNYESELYMQSPETYEKTFFENRAKETDGFISKILEGNKNLKIKKTVKKGKAFVEIISTAREYEVDLIVMCSHGKTGLAETLIGNVAEKVIRKAPCPVLSVKPWGFKFKVP